MREGGGGICSDRSYFFSDSKCLLAKAMLNTFKYHLLLAQYNLIYDIDLINKLRAHCYLEMEVQFFGLSWKLQPWVKSPGVLHTHPCSTIASKINGTAKGVFLPISKLHSILAVTNLLAHNNITICYYVQVNSLRLKSSVTSKWTRKHLLGYHLFCCWWYIPIHENSLHQHQSFPCYLNPT